MPTGTEGDDILSGSGVFDARGGNDTIYASMGPFPEATSVDGGSGFDTLYLTTGTVSGTTAGSFYARTSSSFQGQFSYINIERFILTANRITAVFGDEENWITSNAGTDAASNISTGGGNDRVILNGLQVGATVDLGTGDDLFDASGSAPTSNGVFVVQGGAGNDTMIGSSYRDELYGGSDNDILDGRGSDLSQLPDLLVGGAGNDIYYAYGRETIVENAGEGIDEVRSYVSGLVLAANVENLVHLGTATGFQRGRGNSLDNIVTGSNGIDLFDLSDGGTDTAIGNGGDDYFYFGAAFVNEVDRFSGGAGIDSLILQGNYSGALTASNPGAILFRSYAFAGAERFDLLSGFDNRYGGATGTALNYDITVRFDFIPAGERLEVNASGLAANETLTFVGASGTANERFLIYGGAGADRITTGSGNDIIDGGAGADIMAGGRGDDIYFVDDDFDMVIDDQDSQSEPGGYDTVYTSVSFSLQSNSRGRIEVLATRDPSGTAPLSLSGNAFANTIIGNAGNNAIYGNGGGDKLYGLGGNDNLFSGGGASLMFGGTGDDVFWVFDAFDQAIENAGEGFDAVYTSVSYKLFGNADIELLGVQDPTSTAALTLTGNDIKNQLNGNAGNNTLYGEGGDDTLYGFGGDDYLIGGSGADYMIGGTGDDVYYVDQQGDTVQEQAGEGFDQVYTSSDYMLATGSSIELLGALDPASTTPLVLIGNDEAQIIAGNAGNNILLGGGGRDTLLGGGGDDILDGGAGDDVLTGGSGADTFRFSDTIGAGPANALGWITDFAPEDMIDLSQIDANTTTAGDDPFVLIGTGAFTGVAGQLRYEVIGSTFRYLGDLDGDGIADFYFDVTGTQPTSADFNL